jgi:peptide/nickel transport system substrate-binding protein
MVAAAGLMPLGDSGGAGPASGKSSAGTEVRGGTATWAEPPDATPNYIFPFASSQFSTTNNIGQFQYLMFRPLYMFGHPQNTAPTLDTQLSLAAVPDYHKSERSAVITMKSFKWSNGEEVNATDVLFWMNMMHAEKANWYAYVPGLFPDNITNVVANSPTQLTFTFSRSYNPTWFTYNEFSQITPLPAAWDVSAAGGAPGSGGCSGAPFGAAATDAACAKVYGYLSGLASDPTSYSTNPVWGVVDGPWTIASSQGGSFDSSGAVTFVPNASYSGHKPELSQFQEIVYPTDDAELDALLGGKLDVGFLPHQDAPAPTSNATESGPNDPRLSNFSLTPWVLFGYDYAVLKFLSTGNGGAAGPVFSQLYVRQAMQELVDQTSMIEKFLKGYGVPTYGPVPVLPDHALTGSTGRTNPYPYDPSRAKRLLQSHGWRVVPNGTDTCRKPGAGAGACGAGIPKGASLSFDFAYATGPRWQQEVMQVEQAAWSSIGIHVDLTPESFNTVVSNYAPPCQQGSPCTLEAGWWGSGWAYSPDYYPSGELLFSTGAAYNSSNYDNKKANRLIEATNDTNTKLVAYQNYIARQLPVLWEPNADYQLTEVAHNLRGVVPQNPFANLFPEYWHFVRATPSKR